MVATSPATVVLYSLTTWPNELGWIATVWPGTTLARRSTSSPRKPQLVAPDCGQRIAEERAGLFRGTTERAVDDLVVLEHVHRTVNEQLNHPFVEVARAADLDRQRRMPASTNAVSSVPP
jgi:hypothetical protein